MKSVHKAVKPYKCEKCDSCFNNLWEMSSHIAMVHRPKTVRCKHCQYSTTIYSIMRQHVCTHTKGFCCLTCNSSFQTERLLRLHKKTSQRETIFWLWALRQLLFFTDILTVAHEGETWCWLQVYLWITFWYTKSAKISQKKLCRLTVLSTIMHFAI